MLTSGSTWNTWHTWCIAQGHLQQWASTGCGAEHQRACSTFYHRHGGQARYNREPETWCLTKYTTNDWQQENASSKQHFYKYMDIIFLVLHRHCTHFHKGVYWIKLYFVNGFMTVVVNNIVKKMLCINIILKLPLLNNKQVNLLEAWNNGGLTPRKFVSSYPTSIGVLSTQNIVVEEM